MIQYTDALYSTPEENAPAYDEFRDMFSSGQIRSKEWLVQELENLGIEDESIAIVGAWYGTLGIMLKNKFPQVELTMLDIDPRCAEFVKHILYHYQFANYVTADMYKYSYYQEIVINTSCEHIPDLRKWISLLHNESIVVLQSNNYYQGNGHINCVDSAEAFIEQAGLSEVLYSGELVMPMYTRYMIIGKI